MTRDGGVAREGVAGCGFWNILTHMVFRSLPAVGSLAAVVCSLSFGVSASAQNPGTQQQGPPSLQPAGPPGAPQQPGSTQPLQLQGLPPDSHTMTPEEQAQMRQQQTMMIAQRLASLQARWGPEMSTPGMSIALVEAGKAKGAEGTDLTYHVTGTGFAPGETLTLVRWPLNAEAENVMSGLTLDANGMAVCSAPAPAAAAAAAAPNAPGAAPAPGPMAPSCTTKMQVNQPVEIHATVAAGEPVRVALVSEDRKNGAAVTTVPFPIANEDQGCRLQVLLGMKDGAMVLIEGTGFPANTPLRLETTTAGHSRILSPKTTPDGRLVSVDLPVIKGQTSGETTVKFAGVAHVPSLETDKTPAPDPTCAPSVTFHWGTGSYKVE